MYIAKWKIIGTSSRGEQVVFNPGDEVKGLPKTEIDSLLTLGCLEMEIEVAPKKIQRVVPEVKVTVLDEVIQEDDGDI